MSAQPDIMGSEKMETKKLEDQLAAILQDLRKDQPLATPQLRSSIVNEILTDIRSSFLKCTILPYGLDEIGVGDDETNLYLSVDTYGKVDVASKTLNGSLVLNTASHSAIAQQIFKILTVNSSSYQFVSMKRLTFHASTSLGNLMPAPLPEISFKHVKTNARCKIRLENYFSVQTTKLFNFYSRLDVRFWPLLMLARHWGSRFKCLHSGDTLYFQNYTICLLLVYFLVSKKIIPSLKELQSIKDSGVDKPFVINNFDVSFCSNASVVKPSTCVNPALQDNELRTLSIVSLLKGFFSFCASFDFRTHVICPFLGEAFKRELFHAKYDWKNLPDSISAAYLTGLDGNPRPEKLYLVGPMCIQDILELTTNVTRTITEEEVLKFVRCCDNTSKILEGTLNQSGKVLSDAFSINEGN